jgi:hypothetical protein
VGVELLKQHADPWRESRTARAKNARLASRDSARAEVRTRRTLVGVGGLEPLTPCL